MTWPVSLPQDFLLNAYNHSMANNRLQSSMDQGVPKIRRKQSNGFEPVEGQMIMTKAQLTTLRDYFTNTLEEGTLTFDFDDPISGTTATARFAEPPSWTSTANPAYYSVSLSFIFIL